MITTLAVVAGVTGGTLAPTTVLALGIANLLAEGLSMDAGKRSGDSNRFAWSIALSLAVLFTVGAARARVGTGRWWTNGLEMVGLGAIVGAVAYYAGRVVAALLEG